MAREWLDLSLFVVLLFPGHNLPSITMEEGEIELDFGPWPKEGFMLVECPLMRP